MRLPLIGPAALFAAGAASVLAAASPATQPNVRATTIDGAITQGAWQGAGPQGELQVRATDGKVVPIARDQAMSLRFHEPAASQPVLSNGSVFYLGDGSRFIGKILAGGSKELTVQSSTAGELKIPLASLAGVRFGDVASVEAAQAFSAALADRSTAEDMLITIRDERVTTVRGVLERIAPEGGSFRWRDRSVPVRFEGTYAIVFARGGQTAANAHTLCFLRDGELWGGELVTADAQMLQLKSTLGMVLQLSVSNLWEIQFRSDRVLLVSDLEPTDYEFEPFAATRWPYRRDRSVSNRPLRMDGQVFEHGLGMHSQARLTYALPEEFSQLAGTIGIDDAVRPRGNVVFRVLADGKEVFASGPVSGSDPPRPILVKLGKPKTLELRVDFGEALDIADHADWGQLRLIK